MEKLLLKTITISLVLKQFRLVVNHLWSPHLSNELINLTIYWKRFQLQLVL